MKKILLGIAALSLALVSTLPGTAFASAHNPGTNIVSVGTVYYIAPPPPPGGAHFVCGPQTSIPTCPPPPQDSLIAYPSATVFESFGFNSWSTIMPASSEDLALSKNGLMPYADGTLINDSGTIYAISEGSKHGITDFNVFVGLGYKLSSVINGDTSFIRTDALVSSIGAHLPGTLINQDETIYYVSRFGKQAFPSMDVFNSWGFNLSAVVTANSGDRSIPNDAFGFIISSWQPGRLSPVVLPPQP